MPADLPPLLTFNNGSPVRTPDDWTQRRKQVLEAIVPMQYGGMPAIPDKTQAEMLSNHTVPRFDGARHSTWRLVTSIKPHFSFNVDLWMPAASIAGPYPVIINGDGCWAYVTDDVKAEVLRRGNALAVFNRCEIAADRKDTQDIGLYRVHSKNTFGAVAAWAWGYHRVVDFLRAFADINKDQIAVTGHSRGGKAVLLAGATDTRIAITNPNNSGCGGAGCYRDQGPGSETLGDILQKFPFWFGPDLPKHVGREQELPFDQHFLKALVAPRDLLTTEALGDLWANPPGAFTTHRAAQAVYDLLGAKDRIGVVYREGTHAHRPEDWTTLLDYIDFRFRGQPFSRARDAAPNA